MITRRDALKGLAGILLAGSAPFFVPSRSLMRVNPIVLPNETGDGFWCKFRIYERGGGLLREFDRWLPLSPKHRARAGEIKNVASMSIYVRKGDEVFFS